MSDRVGPDSTHPRDWTASASVGAGTSARATSKAGTSGSGRSGKKKRGAGEEGQKAGKVEKAGSSSNNAEGSDANSTEGATATAPIHDHPSAWPFVARMEAHYKPVNSLSFRYGNTGDIVSGGKDTFLIHTNYNKPSECGVLDLQPPRVITSVDHSPNGKVFACGSVLGDVFYREADMGDNNWTMKAHCSPINSISFSADSTKLLTGSNDKTIKLWQNETEQKLATYTFHTGHVTSVSFSLSTQHLFASGAKDKTIVVSDIRTNATVHTFQTPQIVNGVAMNPCVENLLAAATASGSVRIYDLRKNALHQHYTFHDHALGVGWHPESLWLISCGMEGNVNLFDIGKGTHVIQARDHEGAVRCAQFSRNGKYFGTAGEDTFIVVRRAPASH